MTKKKKNKQATGKNISHGRLLIYLFLVVVAVFMISKLDITGMSTKISLTPTVNAGDMMYMNVDTGKNSVASEFDIYKYYESGKDIRFIQGYDEICRDSACVGKFQLKVRTLDSWKTGKYSVRVYEYRESRNEYVEVFFNVVGVYPGTDEIDEPARHS